MSQVEVSKDQTALTVDDATLPVIDLSGLFTGRPEDKARVAAELGEAARNSGFFYITGHGVPREMMDAMFAASKEFHEKPRSYKMKYWSGFTTNHRGYVPFEENGTYFPKTINFNEAWDMSYEAPADHPDYLAKWRMTGPNVWPDIPGWKETVSGYYDTIFNLGLRLLDALRALERNKALRAALVAQGIAVDGETEILLEGRRADGALDFLVYDGDGNLADRSEFTTTPGRRSSSWTRVTERANRSLSICGFTSRTRRSIRFPSIGGDSVKAGSMKPTRSMRQSYRTRTTALAMYWPSSTSSKARLAKPAPPLPPPKANRVLALAAPTPRPPTRWRSPPTTQPKAPQTPR